MIILSMKTSTHLVRHQDGIESADDRFKNIFFYENIRFLMQILFYVVLFITGHDCFR